MHLLSTHYRSEFLATPQLVRIDYVRGSNGFEPTLLVKGNTLLLKYIVLGARLQFHVARIENRLLYAFTAFDDDSKPATLWSILESEAEADALGRLISGQSCPVFLFNELALNVSWSTLRMVALPQGAQRWISAAVQESADYSALAARADELLEQAYRGTASPAQLVSAEVECLEQWHPLRNYFITSHGTDSPIDLFSTDEGGQQEQLAVWLTDSLQPRGVHHSPQIQGFWAA
jgi:hypothetical protein